MTNNQQFLRVALPLPLNRLFDYLPPQDIDLKAVMPGSRIKVPFQSRHLIGVLIEVVNKASIPVEKLKRAEAILDQGSLFQADIFALCRFASDYYHYALGEVLMGALPTLLRKGKAPSSRCKWSPENVVQDQALALNNAQAEAVSAINQARSHFRVFLLEGITGSGKTEVYLQAIQDQLAHDQQVLVLVPEISLTPQTIERFRKRFTVPIAALHSNLTERERLDAWLGAKNGEVKIVIGTRSAIFTPFANLGLIIVDEEHDVSFKQQDRFRYHARDLSIMRANQLALPIVLGSATPSLESLLNVKRKRYVHLLLPERAGKAVLPQYQLIDTKKSPVEEGLSAALLQTIHTHLQAGNQVMLFLNRRGFAPVVYCSACAYTMPCERCDVHMVYHRSRPHLRCHHCDARREMPAQCPACKANSLQAIGLGTQRLEETLAAHFKDIPIIRIDRDSTQKKGAMESLLAQIHTGEKAILLGTQMLAKGHHFPNVTLVAIIDADSGLFSADFRATEQMGQLLIQVAGRAGRAKKPGTVVIQTRHPDHPLLQLLIHQGYAPFAQTLLNDREKTTLPPFSHFAVLRAQAYAETKAMQFLTFIKQKLENVDASITLLGPVPALIAKRKGLHCQHLLVKANQRKSLQAFLKHILKEIENDTHHTAVKWVLDVDPVEV